MEGTIRRIIEHLLHGLDLPDDRHEDLAHLYHAGLLPPIFREAIAAVARGEWPHPRLHHRVKHYASTGDHLPEEEQT